MVVHPTNTERSLTSRRQFASIYHHWGGLPATLAALDGFQTVRADDPNVGAMFAKLDRLDAAVGSAAGLVAAMTACQFTAGDEPHQFAPARRIVED